MHFASYLLKKNPEAKLILLMVGSRPKIVVTDPELTEKLSGLVGTKIDRQPGDFGRLLYFWMKRSFGMAKTSKH